MEVPKLTEIMDSLALKAHPVYAGKFRVKTLPNSTYMNINMHQDTG